MDPLSDVLSLLKPRSYMAGGFDAAGDWAIRFEQADDGDASGGDIKCYAVVSGACWLTVEDEPAPLRLDTGDAVLLTGARHFCLASDPGIESVDFTALIEAPLDGNVVTYKGGGDFFAIGAAFSFVQPHAEILLHLLPRVAHIDGDAGAAIRTSLDEMARELREPQAGGFLVVRHLAYLVLIRAIRLHVSQGAKTVPGWLSALADRQIGAAIAAMHHDPARRWTLETLAAIAGMSRSTFALRFKEAVGEPAMEYLVRWKMLLAAHKLVEGGDTVSRIAHQLGYESDSAFGAAFRRVTGHSPRDYARHWRSVAHRTAAGRHSGIDFAALVSAS